MIELRHVALHYHYDEYAVLKDLNFTLINGVNTILCDTQSGKSSVCKLLTKQFKSTSGQIFLDGIDIASISNEDLEILYMPANPVFFENRTVRYNVEYPLKVRKVPKNERTERYNEVSTLVGLGDADVKLKKLSYCDRKRVALARGLTVRRKVVLLDDFCGSIEELNKIFELFDNATIVVLTSDVSLACGNVVVLDGGISIYQGDASGAAEIRNNLSWIVDMRSE